MTDRAASLDEARIAKEKAKHAFRYLGTIRGVGITRKEGSYAVKVNLEHAPDPEASLPVEIDGVPIVVHVVGAIHKQSR